METKYYTINIMDTNKVKAERKRKRILHKRIRCACGIIGFIAFFYMLGAIGGLEQNMLTIKEFMVHGIIALVLMLASVEIGERV